MRTRVPTHVEYAPHAHPPAADRRSHFERYRCDVYLDVEPSVPPPPQREWTELCIGAGGTPRPLRFDGPCWLRGVPNAALCHGTARSRTTPNGATTNGASPIGAVAATNGALLTATAANGTSGASSNSVATTSAATHPPAGAAAAPFPPPQWLTDLEHAAHAASLLIEAKPSATADHMDLLLVRPQALAGGTAGGTAGAAAGEGGAAAWRVPYVAAFHESATARPPLL